MKPLNVISDFDGMACGLLALKRAGIPVASYRAFEINKWAIQIAQKNHPEIIQMGDINGWSNGSLLLTPTPDLILAGSPCQGFSVAGAGLAFDDPRSKLFFQFVDQLHYWQSINPNVRFLLENVKMKKEWRDQITKILGVEPVLIDSALVSAQERKRYYWANWTITQPADRGILLKDVIVDGTVDRDKSYCIDAHYWKGGSSDYLRRTYTGKSKRQAVRVNAPHMVGMANDLHGHDYNRRVYGTDGKAPTLPARNLSRSGGNIAINETQYRKLYVVECERLQTVPDGYTDGVSNTQRYTMLGNGWTIDVITHILKENPEWH